MSAKKKSKQTNSKKKSVTKNFSKENERAFKKYFPEYVKKKVTRVPILDISDLERNQRIKEMREIFEVQSESYNMDAMTIFIKDKIDSLGDSSIKISEDYSGNIYVKKGYANTFPCIASHIDTVHMIIPDKDYLVLNSDKEFWGVNLATRGYAGIGGDDKCGIYTCLDNLVIHDNIKLAFFVNEEVGCVGSSVADMEFFDDVSFILQADRQGYKDVASNILNTEMYGEDFRSKIEPVLRDYYREKCEGGMTDVMQLAHNELDIDMANFYCDNYNTHSKDEYIVNDEVILTSILLRDIIREVEVYTDR